jgi:Cu(I)/Ag(I) efflux system membrane fusion protein
MTWARRAGGAALVVVALVLGWYGRGLLAPEATGPQATAAGEGPCPGGAEPLYWKAPMDPTYVRDEPGKSPMGMDLVPVCPGAAEASTGPGIRIQPEVLQNIGVRTVVVEPRDLARRIRAVGRVDYDERLVEHVHTKIQGWIEQLHVQYEGEMVELGQPLLEIYSPELVSTQEELLQAARYRALTAESPFADVAEGGEALFRATRRRLELWDIPDRDIERLLETRKVRKTLTLYGPTNGVVVHLRAREGMEVDPNKNLYTIADLSRVWIYAEIYEYELPWVDVGQRGIVELSYLPGRRFEGEVTYVYPFLDPKTRTARVRLEVPNPGLILKPDMFANVTVETEVRKGALAVPEEAVLRSGQRALVIQALEGGRFFPREVSTGIESGDGWVEIQRGLESGERVVTSGQFLIDSESRLREAVEKFLAPGEKVDQGTSSPEAQAMSGEAEDHGGHAMPSKAGGHEGHAMPSKGGGHEEHHMPDSPETR